MKKEIYDKLNYKKDTLNDTGNYNSSVTDILKVSNLNTERHLIKNTEIVVQPTSVDLIDVLRKSFRKHGRIYGGARGVLSISPPLLVIGDTQETDHTSLAFYTNYSWECDLSFTAKNNLYVHRIEEELNEAQCIEMCETIATNPAIVRAFGQNLTDITLEITANDNQDGSYFLWNNKDKMFTDYEGNLVQTCLKM